MSSKSSSLKEIAARLGISTTTVSKALNNYTDVSQNTRQAVLTLAKELNYTPNSFAVGLRKNQSKTIGVIVPDNVHYFFSMAIKGILDVAERMEYLTFVMQTQEDETLERKYAELLLNKGVDGVIVSLSNKTRKTDHLKLLQNHGVPVVLFDKIDKTMDCSKVVIDDRKAAFNAVSHLIGKGYRRIAHFRGDLNPQNSIDRFLGYKQAILAHGLEYDPELVYLCDSNDDFTDGYSIAKKIMADQRNHVDAIFTVNDLLAIGALKYFNEQRIKIPEEIALMGFSNWFMTSVVSPTLSTVNQQGYEMGQKSAELLFEEIQHRKKDLSFAHRTIVMDAQLVLRESC